MPPPTRKQTSLALAPYVALSMALVAITQSLRIIDGGGVTSWLLLIPAGLLCLGCLVATWLGRRGE